MTEPVPQGFIRVYHLTLFEHAKTNIQFHRLKVATFSDANDPFELLALNCRGHSNREARKSSSSSRSHRAIKSVCYVSVDLGRIQCCGPTTYADRHNGVCLGFDVKVRQ